MFTEVDEAVQLTAAVLLRREQAARTIDQVRSLVRATEQAIEESRKLMAANDALFGAFHGTTCPDPLTAAQLENLAQLVAKARGGCAFIWNPSGTLPVFNPAQSAAIQ
jgi:hypothetical protein